jgi:hypothetical protein
VSESALVRDEGHALHALDEQLRDAVARLDAERLVRRG